MTDLLDIGARVCIICGNPEFPSFEDGLTTYEICPVCGCQSGYYYDTRTAQERIMSLRRTWLIEKEAKWHSGSPPNGWCALQQLNDAGLDIPEDAR